MTQPETATAETGMQIDRQAPAQVGITGLYAYGGVGFEVLVDGAGPWELNEEHLRYAAPASTRGVCALVRVAATRDPSLARDDWGREIAVQWEGASAQVRTREVRAQLCRIAPGRYAAAANVSPGGGSSLTTALVGAVVQDMGGVILHASGAVMNGVGVLFIGPSGAGKTTACNHLDGCEAFARDRAAVYATSSGEWLAWGMAGGDPVSLPAAVPGPVRLAAILRVRHGEGEPMIEDARGAAAHAALRESFQSFSGMDEGRAFGALESLRGSVRVGVASTVIGRSLTAPLRSWLGS